MDQRFLLLAVLLPLLGGALLPMTHKHGPKVMYGTVPAGEICSEMSAAGMMCSA